MGRADRVRKVESGSRAADPNCAKTKFADELEPIPSSKREAGQVQAAHVDQAMNGMFHPAGLGSRQRLARGKNRFNRNQFSAGELVLLCNMFRTEYNSMIAVVLPTTGDKEAKGQVSVQLPDGRRLLVPSNHLVRAEGATKAQTQTDAHNLMEQLEGAMNSNDTA